MSKTKLTIDQKTELSKTNKECIERIRSILTSARNKALQTVNTAMISAYWHIGREIVEEEQRGNERADYGKQLLENLSKQLTAEFGQSLSARNLRHIRRFFLTYRERTPEIRNTLCSKFSKKTKTAFLPGISWSHYRLLMRIPKPDARSFYEVECSKSKWSVRELERQISSSSKDCKTSSSNSVATYTSSPDKNASPSTETTSTST